MKKSIKRFLVMTQVLGLGALAATACTKNASETKSSDTTAKDQIKTNDDAKKSTDASINNSETNSTTKTTELDRSTLVNQSKVVKDTNKTDNDAIRNELLNGVFKNILKTDLIPAESENNANGQLKSLPDLFPITIENEENAAVKKEHKEFLDNYENSINMGELSSDKKVSPSSAIDPSKKSIDGVNGSLDPAQSAPPAKKPAAKK